MRTEITHTGKEFHLDHFHDNQWDGADFPGMIHAIVSVDLGDRKDIYLTHVVGRNLTEVRLAAIPTMDAYLNGDLYLFLDPAARKYIDISDTTV